MYNRIIEESKPFEILKDSHAETLSQNVNDAIERGYEPTWGGLVMRGVRGGLMHGFPMPVTETIFVQAVVLKDKKKFDAWVEEQVRIKKEADEKAAEEIKRAEKRRKKRDKIKAKYIDKPAVFKSADPRIKSGKAVIKSVILNEDFSVCAYKIKRDNAHRIAHALPSEITFPKETKKKKKQ